VKFSVENFGPVRQGEFELKPLTVLIGPNNSGKSYMAVLVYALLQALLGRIHRGSYGELALLGEWGPFSPEAYETLKIQRSLVDDLQKLEARPGASIRDLSKASEALLLDALMGRRAAFVDLLEDALQDYFGCEHVANLARADDDSPSGSVEVLTEAAPKPLIDFPLSPEPTLDVSWGGAELGSTPVSSLTERKVLASFPLGGRDITEELWRAWLRTNGVPLGAAYYLPSARSGILQGSQVLAAAALHIVRRSFALERIEMPALTGVAGDFLQLLWRQPPPRRRKIPDGLGAALEVLEQEMFHGDVFFQDQRTERPVLLYRTRGLELPLNRTSSLVAELAPLDLWIRHLLQPGDLLIIDEPEAHQHPANQRNVARVLVRLVQAGIRVICPTHSSLILHQISNHILASEADDSVRAELGFTEADLLKPEDVGVYLFDLQENGTTIRSVPIEPGFGISEAEFVRVGEAIGEETYRLSASATASQPRS